MKLPVPHLVCLALGCSSNAGLFAAETTLNGNVFTLPEGFTVELVAGPELARRPISADFDEQGRFYVTDSSGSNERVQVQVTNGTHRIVRLEDTDGDGRFDRSVVFADRLMFPEGCLWYAGSLYVAAPPSIWKFTDTDGDGVADRREEWFQGQTLTGCANDLHGPYLGPDGWIYWCKGAFAEQEIPRPGRAPTRDKAAHIFRARPDGSGRESVMAGGMDNPVEVAWTSDGEMFFTCTFIRHPGSGGGRRDGLVQVFLGGVYGKDHDVLDSLPRTGELLEPMVHLGPAAPSGLCVSRSAAWGEDFRDNLFVSEFNLRKISRHRVQPSGAALRSVDEDLLVSDNPNFHPTDVLEDADGSLLVLDTGGWYKLCCPTSQLAKPEVLGAIYRIRRTGAPRVADPRGLRLAWTGVTPGELVARLADPRPAVRSRAAASLASAGPASLPALEALVESIPARPGGVEAVWAIDRIGGAAGTESLARLLATQVYRPGVGLALLNAAALNRLAAGDATVGRVVRDVLHNAPDARWRRLAADVAGRSGGAGWTPSLLRAVAAFPTDRIVFHAVVNALFEVGDPVALRQALALAPGAAGDPASSGSQRAALMTLAGMPAARLQAGEVAPWLASADPARRETARWIAARHPEWGGALREYFGKGLGAPEASVAELVRLMQETLPFVREPSMQRLVGLVVETATMPAEVRRAALEVMGRSRLTECPPEWITAVAQTLDHPGLDDAGLVDAAVAIASSLPPVKAGRDRLAVALLKLARGSETARSVAAFAAVPGGWSPVTDADVQRLLAGLRSDQPPLTRTTAAGLLARLPLSEAQLSGLTGVVRDLGPAELNRLLGAFERHPTEAIGRQLVTALATAKGRAGLRPEVMQARLEKFPVAVRQAAEPLLTSLAADTANQRRRLEDLVSTLPAGDRERGQRVFTSSRSACFSCHQVGYVGGNVGPDLTRIGGIRTRRDLIEAIVFPSASFVRSYEPVIAETRSGDVHSGILRGDNAEGVTLITGPGAEVRVARADLADLRLGQVSVMPEGLDQQLSPQELGDLVAFLQSLK